MPVWACLRGFTGAAPSVPQPAGLPKHPWEPGTDGKLLLTARYGAAGGVDGHVNAVTTAKQRVVSKR